MLSRLYLSLRNRSRQKEGRIYELISLEKKGTPGGFLAFYRALISQNAVLFASAILADILKFFIILSRDAGHGFGVIYQKNEAGSCPFSYHTYKIVQKKVRMFSLGGASSIIFVAVISSLMTNLIFGGKNASHAANFGWLQYDWLGGASSTMAQHQPFQSQSDWSYYDSKSDSLDIANGGSELTIGLSNYSLVQTDNSASNSGFNSAGADFLNIETVGSGTEASLQLKSSSSPLEAWSTPFQKTPLAAAGNDWVIRNGTDDEAFAFDYISNSVKVFRYVFSTDKWTDLAPGGSTPAYIGAGSFAVRNGSSDDIYLIPGNSSTGFYKYTISTNSWTNISATKPIPGAMAAGSEMLFVGSDYIYVMQGGGTGFYKYTISTNSWTNISATKPIPGNVSSGAKMLLSANSDDIYVLRGNMSTGFYKYTISTDSWTNISATKPVPGSVSAGGTMMLSSNPDDIFVVQGWNTAGFYKYTISTDSWTNYSANGKPVPGVVTGSGGTAIRNDDNIFVLPGGNTPLFKYSISANTWTNYSAIFHSMPGVGSRLISAPGELYIFESSNINRFNIASSTMQSSNKSLLSLPPSMPGSGSYSLFDKEKREIYLMTAWGSTNFFKYSIANDSWTNISATKPVPGGVNIGASMVFSSSSDEIYVLRGGATTGFYKYTISTDSWTNISATKPVPGGVSYGGAMLLGPNKDVIYVLGGNNSTGFYKYTISTDSWTNISATKPVPGAVNRGGGMVLAPNNDDIYVLGGNYGTGFYKYTISTDSWTNISATKPVPGNVGDSGDLIFGSNQDDIYVLAGNNSTGFYKYTISTDSWTNISATKPLPSLAGLGGQLIRPDFQDDIYVLHGAYSIAFSRYNVASNTWTVFKTVPGWGVIDGGKPVVYDNLSSDLYMYGANGFANFNRFRIKSMAYEPSGTYTSASLDLGFDPQSWQRLALGQNLNGQAVELKVRTSATSDFSGAPAWADCSALDDNDLLLSGGCANPAHRFVQYQARLSSNSSSSTPRVSAVGLGAAYYPTNQSLISSVYDTKGADNKINLISWSEHVLPADTDIIMSLRAASSAAALASSTWHDFDSGTADCSKAGQVVTCPLSAIMTQAPGLAAGSDSRFFQYRFLLNSNGAAAPVAAQARVNYLVNAPPQLDADFGVVATKNPDNTVTIQYKPRDIDTDMGLHFGAVDSSFYYSYDGENFQPITSGLPENATSGVAVDTDAERLASGSPMYGDPNSGFAPYSVVWTPTKGIYSDNLVIKVVIDDGGVNGTASATSAPFMLDSKIPIYDPVVILATGTPAEIFSSSTDDSSQEMIVSLNSDFSGAEWQPYNSTTSIELASDPDVVYLKYRDQYLNETPVIEAMAPNSIKELAIQDTSNVKIEPSDLSLFLVWKTADIPAMGFGSYEIYRSTDQASWQQAATIGNRLQNYFFDKSVNGDDLYFYQVVVKDGLGSKSFVSATVNGKANGVQDYGEGGGGMPESLPVITNVATSSIQTTQADITWDTDVLSNSRVEYMNVTGGDFSAAQFVEVPTMANNGASIGQHRVVLSGLDSDATYFFQVKSTDPYGNTGIAKEGEDGFFFTTLSGPKIFDVNQVNLKNDGATIVWKTDGEANSYVVVSTSSAFGTEISFGNDVPTLDHAVELSGLKRNTAYYYYVKSNPALNNNAGNFYTFTTLNDAEPPIITRVKAESETSTEVLVDWRTNEPANSLVYYGLSSGDYSTSTGDLDTAVTSHVVELYGLSHETTYYFVVVSTDASGNTSTSTEGSFETYEPVVTETVAKERETTAAAKAKSEMTSGITVINKSDTTAPGILKISVSDIAATSATVNWLTDEKSTELVIYNAAGQAVGSEGDNELRFEHAIKLKNLRADTEYAYHVESLDANGNLAKSAELRFVTAKLAKGEIGQEEESGQASAGTAQPDGGAVQTAEDKSQLVAKALSRAAELLAEFAGDISIGSLESTLMSQYDALNKLSIMVPAPILSAEPAVSVTANSASIKWRTNKEATSFVAYGPSVVYDLYKSKQGYNMLVGDPEKFTLDHQVSISGLLPQTVYHYQVKSKAKVGAEAVSRDFTFKTLDESFDISNFYVDRIAANKASVKWVTNMPADSQVTYIPYRDNKLSVEEEKTMGDKHLTIAHEFTLEDLESGVIYQIELQSVDGKNRKSVKQIPAFSTSKDDLPPEISQVQTESMMSQGKDAKVQTIITWMTNEPTICQLSYDKGVVKNENVILKNKLPIESGYSKKHTVVITDFEPATVYSLQISSTDSGGNTTKSPIRTIITPRQKETVFDLILTNFKETFGWINNIKNIQN